MPSALIVPFRTSERNIMSGHRIDCVNCGTVPLHQYEYEWMLFNESTICPRCGSTVRVVDNVTCNGICEYCTNCCY